MGIKHISAVALLAATASCATTPQAPYRVPQATINGATAEQVKMPIMQACASAGGSIETATDHQIVCAKPMDDSMGSLLYRALATPKYATNPVIRARYTLVESGGNVFVTIDTFSQYQNAFGQVNTTPIQNGNIAAQAQGMLDRIKASIEGQDGATPPTAPRPSRTAPVATPAPAPATQPQQSDWRKWGQKGT
jgi:hypothetical protein